VFRGFSSGNATVRVIAESTGQVVPGAASVDANGFAVTGTGQVIRGTNGQPIVARIVAAATNAAGGFAGQISGAAIKQTKQLNTGEILCLVAVPAQFETVSRQVIVTPATVRRVAVPAQTRTVQRRVVSVPAQVRRIPGTTGTTGGFTIVSTTTGAVIPGAVTVSANGLALDASGTPVHLPAGFSGGAARVIGANGAPVAGAVAVNANGLAIDAAGNVLRGASGPIAAAYAGGSAGTGATGGAAVQARATGGAATSGSRTVQRRVINTPASVRRVAVPAQTRTIQRRVIATPACSSADPDSSAPRYCDTSIGS